MQFNISITGYGLVDTGRGVPRPSDSLITRIIFLKRIIPYETALSETPVEAG